MFLLSHFALTKQRLFLLVYACITSTKYLHMNRIAHHVEFVIVSPILFAQSIWVMTISPCSFLRLRIPTRSFSPNVSIVLILAATSTLLVTASLAFPVAGVLPLFGPSNKVSTHCRLDRMAVRFTGTCLCAFTAHWSSADYPFDGQLSKPELLLLCFDNGKDWGIHGANEVRSRSTANASSALLSKQKNSSAV